MELTKIRNKLKKCQPYFIEKDLLPKLYFKEEKNNDILNEYGEQKDTEYWIFYYSFIRKLTDKSIGIRLNYTAQNVHRRCLIIIKNNLFLINNFLEKML